MFRKLSVFGSAIDPGAIVAARASNPGASLASIVAAAKGYGLPQFRFLHFAGATGIIYPMLTELKKIGKLLQNVRTACLELWTDIASNSLLGS